MSIHRTTGLTPLHIASGLLLGGFCLSSAHGQASFQGLGDLPGNFIHSQAIGVSPDGSVVVGASSSASLQELYRWTCGSGMVGLGSLPGNSIWSIGIGTSAKGSVVVGFNMFFTSGSTSTEAFRWTSGGGIVGLGYLSSGHFFGEAWGVSADGSVVVGFSRNTDNWEAFRWTSEDGMVGLGFLPTSDTFLRSQASDVSADGSVVVGASSGPIGTTFEAFRWTSEGGMVGLGHLLPPDPSGGGSGAKSVSADGSVVVGTSGGSVLDHGRHSAGRARAGWSA